MVPFKVIPTYLISNGRSESIIMTPCVIIRVDIMILLDIVAVLPVYAYWSQLQLIKKEGSLGSFSIYVCAILIISAILRVFFWLTVGYALNLLFQAIFIIVIQLMLLKECVELSNHSIGHTSAWKKFWKWETYEQYMKFLLGLTAVMTVLTLTMQLFTFGYFGQMIGLLSMGIESTLGVPQLISNWQTKSVQGLSFTMIGMWFLGDFAKTVYFIMENQPFQFTMCGVVQLTVDILIIIQIILYSKENYLQLKPTIEGITGKE